MTAGVQTQGLPVVIKVGGSLTETGRAKSVLSLIAGASRRTVIVPGGGVFADSVRELQRTEKFDDATAHWLAMRAMHQMAELFVTLVPKLEIADSLDAITETMSAGRIPVWVPLPMMASDPMIAESWDATSDTLAARLAELLGRAPLVLLKSCDIAPDQSVRALSAASIVDRAFPAFVERAGLSWRALGPDGDAELAEIIGSDPRFASKS